MALIQCNFFSEVLGISTSMTVILPQQTKRQIGLDNKKKPDGRHPTLYLLHGLSDDDTAWVRKSSIERYVASRGLAVVMPNVHRSFYTDMAFGGRYWTFLSEELPEVAHSFFPLSDKREDNFVAGLSMGGYGAFKWALRQPERFAAAASLSGALDMTARGEGEVDEELEHMFKMVFGDGVAGTDNDLLWLLEQGAAAGGPKPKLFQCCGTEDFLYEDNLRFTEVCRKSGYELTDLYDPGAHEWNYWDEHIKLVLDWLPLGK